MWTHASLCELLPHCTLSEQARVLEAPASMMTAQQHARMLRDGYYPVTASVGDATTRSSLLAGIEALVRAGLPASLIYTTDQAWRLSEAALALLPRHLDTQLTGDVLAWHVGPGTAGFAPHRDRQPDDVPSSFGPDGLPRYATLWLALTDVSSETSCLSVVPAACDPGYAAGDAVDDDAPTPLQVALPTKEAFQHIRALTGPAGSAWCFSHRTLHWGSANPPDSGAARISMSFVASDAAFEPSYLTDAAVVPGFAVRLALVCAQLICYHEHFPPPSAEQLQFCFDTFQAALPSFREHYTQKVYVEFVAAVQALGEAATDSLLDAAQQCMLESAWDGFVDDFDGDDGDEALGIEEVMEEEDDDAYDLDQAIAAGRRKRERE